MKRITLYILLALSLLVAVSSCVDELYAPGYEEIPEGISTFDVEVGYRSYTPSLESRASGTALREIKSLWVVIYDGDGVYIDKKKIVSYTTSQKPNQRPDGQPTTESTTGRAEFKLTLANGYYKMYAVANHDLTDEDVDTEEKLRNIPLQWSDNLEDNAEMLGYFTNGSDDDPDRYDENGNVPSAPRIPIKDNTKLHSWLRRVASKVTVAFDTRTLRENINIYIKSVAIKDIPTAAYLGRRNTPGEKDRNISSDLKLGEVIYLKNAEENHEGKADHSKWFMIASGDSITGIRTGFKGAAPLPAGTPPDQRLEYEHNENAPALYFYENMQGQGVKGTESDKRQDVDGNNSQVSYPHGTNPADTAWKDTKKYGTYVEVQGYYENNDTVRPGRGDIIYRFMLGKNVIDDYDAERNHHYRLTLKFNGNANDIDWHIDYKEEEKPGLFTPDTTYVSYLYNQPASTVARATPRKGYEITGLKAVIVNNEWRPYLESDGRDIPKEGIYRKNVSAKAQAYYNHEAWNWQNNGGDNYTGGAKFASYYDAECANNCEFGFLSLRYVKDVTKEFGGNTSGVTTRNLVSRFRAFYNGDSNAETTKEDPKSRGANSKGYREYNEIPTGDTGPNGITYGDADNGTYTVHRTTNTVTKTTDYVFSIPLYTRAKSLDSWAVYSGANAFYEHHRYARVKFIATYKKVDKDVEGDDNYTDTSYSVVLQARRVDNPRGIYRRYNNNDKFNVVLKYTVLEPGDGEKFRSITSRGPWSATIEQDPGGLVKLTTADGQSATGKGGMVTGRTNTPIAFTYTPNITNPKIANQGANDVYGAIITVRYHNNSCIHKIIVRKGYSAHIIGPANGDKHKWSCFNVYDGENLTKSPLSVGSYFRRYTSFDYPILESNNTLYGVGVIPEAKAEATYKMGKNTQDTENNDMTWEGIPSSGNAAANAFGTNSFWCNKDGRHNYRIPNYSELWEVGIVKSTTDHVNEANDINFAFGIFYADGATKTLTTKDAYSYTDYENKGEDSEKGVWAIGAYSLSNGDNIIFPMGATGHARRKGRCNENGDEAGYGYMRYGSVDFKLIGKTNNFRPMAWNLPAQEGAAYWVNSGKDEGIAIDFNSGNYMTAYLNRLDLYTRDNLPDALPVKCILLDDNPSGSTEKKSSSKAGRAKRR